jgi:signal transduction histidine kinase
MVTPQLRDKKIQFEHVAPDSPITCYTDGDKLQQIFVNLLSNAVKFTNTGGSITTVVRLVEDQSSGDGQVVEVDVRDTGVGIAADQLDSVFLPFVQINRSLSHPREGIGLGLAISRELARGLGGDLTVRSEAGKGSTFTLRMPLNSKV